MKLSKRTRHRGSILIIAALFTFLCLLAAFTLFKVLPVEYNSAKKSRLDGRAHYTADAGVKDALTWLESQPRTRVLSESTLAEFNDSFGQRREVGTDWETEVTIERIESGHFGITSEAFYRSDKVREIKAQVALKNFSGYALFIDHWPLDGQGETALVYNLGQNLLTGPFHTNDFFVLAHQDQAGFNGSGEPFVSGPYAVMTHSRTTDFLGSDLTDFQGDGNAYVSNFNGATPVYNTSAAHVPFDTDGALEDRYERVVEGGRGNLGQIEPILFPDTAIDRDGTPLREKARGLGNTEFQGRIDTGVYVPRKNNGEVYGGVYVVGDSELSLRLDDNGNQVQRFSQTHLAETFVETETVEVTSPRYIRQERTTPPAFVEEVRQVPGTRRVIVGYESHTVTTTDGITQPVQTPVYGEEAIMTQELVSVPYDPDIHGTGPFYEYVEDLDNPHVYDTVVTNPISEDEYDPENPNHEIQYQEAGDRVYEVVEVTEDSGYQIAPGLEIEGGSSNVAKENTVFIDYAEGKAVVSQGNLNGVTFADGNIESLGGTVKGSVKDGPQGHAFSGKTIAVAPEFGKKVTITNHLRQFYDRNDSLQGPNLTLKDGELPPSAQHSLGLIGHDVELGPNFQTDESSPLTIYAVILAGRGLYHQDGTPVEEDDDFHVTSGGFGTADSLLSPDSDLSIGRFRLYGGIIEANARPWFEAPFGTLRGLEGELIFDPAAASGLQDFPSTRTFRVVRYSEYPDFD